MRLVTKYSGATLTLMVCLSFASAPNVKKPAAEPNPNRASPEQPDGGNNETSASDAPAPKPILWIHLIDGRRMQVDEAAQTTDGIWYTRDNVSTFLDSSRVVRIERSEDRPQTSRPDSFSGTGRWKISDSAKVENFFLSRFKRSLPLTAFGQSELHSRWGLDHRESMDIGLHPDSTEGQALIRFLLAEEIPFLAFRGSVPGVATGPHIHVGNTSSRLRSRQ
ncbi:MAG: hypothetical protein M3539_03255 [Acidobacteriota bacterium]|nr:hypothetical protein [Acidobacteriota bacterium]